MTKNENDLDQAYLSGLEASLWWGKFTEFLYTTNEGEAVRKELQKDYLTWQVEELGRDPAKGLLEWQVLFKKLFPDQVAPKESTKKKKKGGSGAAGAKDKKKEKTTAVSPNGVKRPKKIENKPRKIELKAPKNKKGENGGATKAVNKNSGSSTKTKKEIKFKNIK